MIKASFGRDAYDKNPELREFSDFGALCAAMQPFRIVGPSDAEKCCTPYITPAELLPDRRLVDDGIRCIHFGMLDFDGLTEAELEQVLEIAKPLQSFFYTTHGHAKAQEKGLWKFRLGFPFSRPVDVAEWPQLWPRLVSLFKGRCDKKCRNPSRMYFLPCVPTEDKLALAVFEVAEGGALDVDSFLRMEASVAGPPSASNRIIGVADIEALAARLCRRRSDALKKVGKALQAVAKGEVFAEVGERDDMMFQAASHIAESWPDLEPASVHALFQPSIDKMLAADPTAPDLSTLVAKLDRAQKKADEERNRREQEEQDANRVNIRAAYGGRRDHPYSDEELEGFAKDAGVSKEAFRKRWILENGEHHYLFFDGQYLAHPVSRTSLWLAAEKWLSPALPAGVSLRTVNKDGDPRRLNADELIERYGTHIKAVEMDFKAQRTHYDAARDVLVEAPCPLRRLEPERSEAVEYWLENFAGTANVDKLLDWIAKVTDLDEPCAALYVSGASGAGKTLLADGLARLWTLDGPTEMGSISGSFNEDMARCPLVFADETVPESFMKGDGTGWFRQLVQGRVMRLRRKFKPEATLKGAVRVVFAANNETLLRTRALLTPDDAEAVANRILHIPVDTTGRYVLEFLREDSPEVLDGFVRKDAIAKHALWLKETRKVARGRRFLVEGGSSSLERSLLTSSDVSASVVEWCLGYLANPVPVDAKKSLLVRIENGRLLVNVKALVQEWFTYIPAGDKMYPAQTLSNALTAVSEKSPVRLAGRDGHPVDYRVVKLDVLHSWGMAKGYATVEQIDAALGRRADRDREPGEDDDTPF